MDLADVGGNVRDGVPHRQHRRHLDGDRLRPGRHARLRREDLASTRRSFVEKLRFPLTVRGQRLEVDIENGRVTYTLQQGAGLTHPAPGRGDLKLTEGKPVTRTL